jgi:hypothetical protein
MGGWEDFGINLPGPSLINAPAREDAPGLDIRMEKDLQKAGMREEEWPVAEILTARENRTPSRKEYFSGKDTPPALKNEKTSIEKDTTIEGQTGIPPPPYRDIEVEILLDESGAGLSALLLKKAHPMVRNSAWERHEQIRLIEGPRGIIAGGKRVRKTFSVASAKRGAYTFIIGNNGEEARYMDIGFLLRGGGGRGTERHKRYKGVIVSGNENYKVMFIMPEALFWDDEDFFSGTIEGPDEITRFNSATGLVWKETKGRPE